MNPANAAGQFSGIQILRFAAAMLVVVMHITQAISVHIAGTGADSYWRSGSAGVDIFFVISGFVMGASTGNPAATVRKRASAAWVFIKRRLLRIAPLYWFYTLLKVATLLVLPDLASRFTLDPVHLAASLLFIPDMAPWHLIEPVLPVGWTLNFEMLFYLVFAAAIALGAPKILFCLLVFLVILICGHLFPESVALAFYAKSIVFEFIFGICISHACKSWKQPPPLVGLVAIFSGIFYIFFIDWDGNADRMATWGAGAALLVIGAVWMEPWITRIAAAKRLSFFGDASYSIYLSHTFVVPATVLAFMEAGVRDPVLIMAATILGVVVAGSISYVWIERPMTNALKRAFFRPPAVAFASPDKTHAK